MPWDTAPEASNLALENSVSNFESDQINGSLDYKSYIQFGAIGADIRFSAELNCSNSESSKPIAAKKDFKLSSENKVYMYDLLPESMIFEPGYKNSSSDYRCDLKVVAGNKIDSSHEFTLASLPINTHSQNELNVFTFSNASKSPGKLSISNRNPLDITGFPSLEIDDNRSFEYMLESDLAGFEISEVKIKCLGDRNTYLLDHENSELNSDLNSKLRDKLFVANNVSFLKKCRALTILKPKSTQANNDKVSNRRVAWSEYFNVVFDRPVIEATTFLNPELDRSYPYNLGDYLDVKTHVFSIQFKNLSKKDLRLHLPDQNSIAAIQSPLITKMQRSDFGKRNGDKVELAGLQLEQVDQSFESSLEFMLDDEPVSAMMIPAGHEVLVKVFLDKNFACDFGLPNSDDPQTTAESGFRLQAIAKGSDQDSLKVEYLNQGQLEKFPQDLLLSHTLQTSKSNYFYEYLFYTQKISKTAETDDQFAIDTYFSHLQLSTQNTVYRDQIKESPSTIVDPIGPKLALIRNGEYSTYDLITLEQSSCYYAN